jgi:hypothetical protein
VFEKFYKFLCDSSPEKEAGFRVQTLLNLVNYIITLEGEIEEIKKKINLVDSKSQQVEDLVNKIDMTKKEIRDDISKADANKVLF